MSRRVTFTTLKPIDAAVSKLFVPPAFQRAPSGLPELPGNKRMADKIAELEARYSTKRPKKAKKVKKKKTPKKKTPKKKTPKKKTPKKKFELRLQPKNTEKFQESLNLQQSKKKSPKRKSRRGGTHLTERTTLESIVRQLSWGSTPLTKLLKTTGPLHKRASLLSLLRKLPRTTIFGICGKSGCS